MSATEAPAMGAAARAAAGDGWTPERIAARAAELGPWFHNLDLRGVRTAPDHFLYDYPAVKFRGFAHALPADLSGKTVLDLGCNGGFYAMEMKRRGAARVLGVDSDERYLAQARFAAEVEGLDVEFLRLDVYDVAALGERFDLVVFMGVLYHLRHPLLALDLIREHAARDLLLYQSLQRGPEAAAEEPAEDYGFFDPDPFGQPGWPRMHFVERRYAGDPTNWWVPNRACSAAMLRSAGFDILANPDPEVFLCRVRPLGPDDAARDGRAVHPARGPGDLAKATTTTMPTTNGEGHGR